MLRVAGDRHAAWKLREPIAQSGLYVHLTYDGAINAAELRPYGGLDEGVTLGAVKILHLQVQLVSPIFSDHADANQLAINEIGEFGIQKNQHVSSFVMSFFGRTFCMLPLLS